ncbi:MAG TPA: TonB-dependent receptor [Terriglobales bacterium]|nr:TonB-dependent receptor [Terriglobales bacterium]
MSKLRSLSPLLVAVAAFTISIAPVAQGQTAASTATFSGSVSDSTGARVPNANVTINGPDKGITRTYKTDTEGNFSFALLPASTYTLTVSAQGFKTFRQEGIALEVGQSASQSVTMTIGTAEQVEVTSEAPLLQTDNANVGAEVSTKQITELPLNLRNVFNFVELNSSVNNLSQRQTISSGGQQGSSDQDVSFLNFGGGYFGTNAFLLDGAWDTSEGWGGVIYVPSPDNVQEFKVQQNSFSAQYGWSTGNVINVVTKSGGSGLHGDIYDYLRNAALDANHFSVPVAPKPNSHRNQFGVAVGGPVYIPGIYKQRDKTFFFFNFEGHRDHNGGNTSGISPIPGFRNGDFSALLGANIGTDACGRPILSGQLYDPFSTRPASACGGPATSNIRDPIAGNNLATYTSPFVPGGAGNLINAIGQKLINYYPAANPGNPTATNWSASGVLADYSDEYSGRIDHNFTERTRLYGRYSYKKEYKDEEAAFYGASDPAGPGQRNPNNRWNVGLGISQVFSPTFTMSVNLGGMKWVEGNDMQSKGFKASTLGLPSFIDTYSPQFPIIAMPTGYLPEGPVAGAGQGAFPRAAASGSVDFVKSRGPHQLSFGYMAVATDENGGRFYQAGFNFDSVFSGGPDPAAEAAGTGNPFASMLMGVPAGGSAGVAISNVSRTWFHGVYLQDDWKATRKLTLNLGLRYEIQRPVTDRYNRQASFDYNAVNPISSAVGQTYKGALQYATSGNRGLFDTNYKNFAPRLGFAYQLMPKLVMRGGYGVFYPPTYRGTGPAPGFTSVTPYVSSNNAGLTPANGGLSGAFSGGLVPVTGSSQGGLTDVGFNVGAVSRSRKTYYVQQWSYGVQYAPTHNDVLDITYVGNHGVHVISSGLNLNQLDPKYFSMGSALLAQVPNPFHSALQTSAAGSPCNLDQPTVAAGQLLRPYPEFCDINENQDPAGTSHYNALDVNYTHRVSQGLTLLASYTFSKFIDDVGGPENWASASANFSENIRNVYNLAAEKSVDATDTPHSFVLSYVYELPVGKGRKYGSGMNGIANTVIGGWQTSGTLTLKEGFPLTITQSNTNPFGVGQHVNVVGDYHLSHPTAGEWFNPSAFAVAPQFTLGNAPRYFSDLRAPAYKNWDVSIQKYFPVNERFRFQFRMDMFNALNHTNYYSPNTFYGPPPSVPPQPPFTGGSFTTITNAWTARQMQAALKFYW